MLKILGATSVTINEPALELPKNRFDERTASGARDGLNGSYDALLGEELQMNILLCRFTKSNFAAFSAVASLKKH